MSKWKLLKADEDIDDMAIVYSKTRGVTIGLPGWNYSNNAVTHYMPLPEHVITDRTGWFSEYWGDELPKKRGWYIVSLDCSYGIPDMPSLRKDFLVSERFYDVDKRKWNGNSGEKTVIAYMPYPKPPNTKEAKE